MSSEREKLVSRIKEIRDSVNELNEAHQPAINMSLNGIVDQLITYLLKKQTKLENYVEKLRDMTKDEVANGLLDSILNQLKEVGESYANILKIQSQTKPSSELENIEFMLRIVSEIFQLILKLQMIEDVLNTHIGDPQLDSD